METNLTVAAIQTKLFWEDPQKNYAHLEGHIKGIPDEADLIILPEMFTTGFTMAAEKWAETLEGETVKWLRFWAKKKQAAIGGSVIIKEGDKFFNRFLFISPSGEIQYYDKRHTFTLAGEDKAYASGENEGRIVYKGWKICLRVCYDLRFPVWSRNTSDYDVLIYTANWPHTRIHSWDTLLQARAIENMSYCMGINRVGTDGSGLKYPGHTAIYDYMGEALAQTKPKEEGYCISTLSKEKLETVRKKLPFLADRDHFTFLA